MDDEYERMPLHPAVKRYIEATRRAGREEREALLRFAPVLCRCHTWYDWRDPAPPQEDCYVHTTVMLSETGWL